VTDHTLEIAQAVHTAMLAARETISRLTIEKAVQAVEIDRLRRENFRHRRQGLLRLAADLRKSETLLDVAARRMDGEVNSILDGESLPGWERGRDWFDTAVRNGCTDEQS
jgi:hypothetical protein